MLSVDGISKRLSKRSLQRTDIHPGTNRVAHVESVTGKSGASRPIVLDLERDLTPPWRMMTEAAELAKVLLDEVELQCFVENGGGKGYHIVIPLTRRDSWDEAKSFSQAIARHLAKVCPDRFSAALGPKNRVGEISIDYLRISKAAKIDAAYFGASALRRGRVHAYLRGQNQRKVKKAD